MLKTSIASARRAENGPGALRVARGGGSRRSGRGLTGWLTTVLLGGFLSLSCATLNDLATPDLGDFGPSEAGVRELLDTDRVREALEEARDLARRYPGIRSRVLLGRAQWRNGELARAERSLRAAAENGVPAAAAGLADVLAARGDWQRAVELAESALGSIRAEREARAVLTSAAWWRREAAATSRGLRAWSRVESGTAVPRALAAMALAIDDLEGPALRIEGEPGTVRLGADGGVPVVLAGRSLRFRLDPAAGQTRVSPDTAGAAGLSVRRGGRPEGGPSRRALPIFALEQAACPELRIGDTVLRHLVVGVAPVPDGFDGVLGADLLARLRWSLRPDADLLAVGPPDAGRRVERLVAERETSVLAWLGARVAVRALGVQLLFYPRVGDRSVPAELDLTRPSGLDLVASGTGAAVAGGEKGAETALVLGGRRWDVAWEERSLAYRARGGGVAPQVTLGPELFRGRVLHWIPETAQLRVEGGRRP